MLGLASTAATLLAPCASRAEATLVPAPQSVLGFVPGEDRRLADWGQVVDYLTALAAASPRLRLEEVGRTTEGRPFLLVTVTSLENQARLQAIRQASARLWDPRGLSADEADRLLQSGRVVVAMTFSIHSTEVGGTLAALRLLHRLASADDAETRAILDQAVLLAVPSQNPDGTELVARWYRQQLSTAFEGTAPPQLYHPYVGHDNNRDWYMFSQQETRLVLESVYRRWHPQIVHDVHQMGQRGARLFVPPYIDPWEPNVDGALVAASNALGAHVASQLATLGRSGVLTSALYDAWTPGRAYVHTHGGVRILSETASARLATPVFVRADELEADSGFDPRTASSRFPLPWAGGRWSLADVVDTQLQVSLAVLDHAARNREHWLRTSLEANRRACARAAPYAFVIPARQRDPLAARRLVQVLQDGEVVVETARFDFQAGGAHFPAGSRVVRLAQPAGGFAKALLERQRYPQTQGPGGGAAARPYDVTAHTLPLLLGVEVEAVASAFTAELATGAAAMAAGEPAGGLLGTGPRYALGHTSGELKVLGELLARGARVRWALDDFADAGRGFAAGTLLVAAADGRLLQHVVRPLGIVAPSIRADPRSLRLVRPRVGLYRSWLAAIDEGWTRFVFEREMSVGFEALRDEDVRAGDLRRRFDAIVLPAQAPRALREGYRPGSMPPRYTGGLGDEGVSALRSFVEEGGTLVALDTACDFAIEALRLPVRDVLAGGEDSGVFCPGSILEARLFGSSPLTAGLPDPLPVWFEGSPGFEAQAGSVLLRYEAEQPLLSGLLVRGSRLRGRAALVEAKVGRGRVVLIGFRPQYRAQSRVSYPVLLNALYLSAARP